MTNREQQELGFRAGVRAYKAQSPYELSKTVKRLKSGAWGCRTPYIDGFLQGAGEPGEYGYDTDSRKAERTYKAVKQSADKLRKLLGDDAYTLLTDGSVERL